MHRNKEDIVVIVFACILVVIVFVIAFITYLSDSKKPQTIKATSQQITTHPSFAAPSAAPFYFINTAAEQKLLNKVNKRQPLSATDQTAKATILTNLPAGQQSGNLYESPNIVIEYVNSANVFQVEILTTNIQQAKDEANRWFRTQGMSQEGICDYPVMFYLNSVILEKIKQGNVVFSPLPNSC